MVTIIEKQVIENQHVHQEIPVWVQVRLERIEEKLDNLTATVSGFIAGNLSPENQAKVDAVFQGVADNITKVTDAIGIPEGT